MIADANQTVSELDGVSPAVRRALLSQGDGGAVTGVGSVPERLAAQAVATPDAPALVMGDASLRYAELDARANR
ncbi:peptide synthase [compost metagenome]